MTSGASVASGSPIEQCPSPETHELRTPDGARLHLVRWLGPSEQARGTVQIVHGLGEHVGRYAQVARTFNQAGWHVAGHDLRGHGKSDGRRGDIPHANSHQADLALVLTHLQSLTKPANQHRHVLLGHSMGGAIAAGFVADGLDDANHPAKALSGLILSSPALDPGMNRLQQLLLATLGGLAPHLLVGNGLQPEWISRDPAVVRAYRSDPMVHKHVSAQTVNALLDSAARALQAASRWCLPTLLLWAGGDRCVAPGGSAAFKAAASGAVQGEALAGLAHEIMNEPERQSVLARMVAWLDAVPSTPPGQDHRGDTQCQELIAGIDGQQPPRAALPGH